MCKLHLLSFYDSSSICFLTEFSFFNKMESSGEEDQVSITCDDYESVVAGSDSDESSSSFDGFGFFTRNGMVEVKERSPEHKVVKRCFLSGLGQFGERTDVVAIHRNSNSCWRGQARFEAFQIFSTAVAKKCGGSANIKHGWYGGSRDEICEILAHGFSRCGKTANGESYGVGIHLSPAKFPLEGVLSSVVDENGLKHVLLCRVILGNMEVVSVGSNQTHPSTKEFDSGVDNLSAPRRYIVWSAYMNSHIFPCYILSFKPPAFRGSQRMQANPVKVPISPRIMFPTLMSILSRFLPSTKMSLIVKCYNDFKGNKITRPLLIRRMRQIAGDTLLIAVMKSYRNKQFNARIL